MTYADAMKNDGIDKPDIRFGMCLVDLTEVAKGKGFDIFNQAEFIVGICAPGMAEISRKKIDEITKLSKSSEIGANGLVWVKYEPSGTLKSSVDKFYTPDDLQVWAKKFPANPGDLILIFSGPKDETLQAMGRLRLAIASELGLRDRNNFKPLWVVDFPLLEWEPKENRWQTCHHPFTSPKPEDIHLLESHPGAVRARAYDLVINGVEVGGGSIRMHTKSEQLRVLRRLGFTEEQAENTFGFLMQAFEYGAPPHGGVAFGFDRLCSIIGLEDNIRPFIAFPKNREGRDTMIDAPSPITDLQLAELNIRVVPKLE